MRLRPAAATLAASALLLTFVPAASADPLYCLVVERRQVLHIIVRPFEWCVL